MTRVQFYDRVDDEKLRFAVIVTKTNGHWVFCKHRERNTLEVPGGHREPGEEILNTAKRELYEETGAIDFTIEPVCVYSVTSPKSFNGQETFGMAPCLCSGACSTFESTIFPSSTSKMVTCGAFPKCCHSVPSLEGMAIL